MTRRRTRAPWAALLAALVAAFGLSACGGGASTPASPGDGAARVVPVDALAFVSVALDRQGGGVAQAGSALADLHGYQPALTAVRKRLSEITGVNFDRGIRPWLGAEAAVAFVPHGTRASELIVLGVRDRAGARGFAARVRAPFAARLVDGYVVIGEPGVVAAAGHTAALASLPAFQRALSKQPPDRVADVYGTGAGLAELLGGHAGLASVAAEVLSAGPVSVISAALAPTSDGLRLRVALSSSGGRPTARFTPTLAGQLPAQVTWMVDMPSLTGSGPGLVAALAAGTGTSRTSQLIGRLGTALRAEGVALAPLASLFSHQSAIFELDSHLGLITATADPTAARLELGTAGQALAELLAPPAGDLIEPVVSTAQVGRVAVTVYRTGPSSQLATAVVGRDVVITTSRTALVAIIDRKATLSGSSLYQSVLAGSGPSVSPVLYGALNRLIRHGGEAGALEQLGLSGAAPALAQISAAGLASVGGHTETTSELYFTIS
jgi:hypothetical protein